MRTSRRARRKKRAAKPQHPVAATSPQPTTDSTTTSPRRVEATLTPLGGAPVTATITIRGRQTPPVLKLVADMIEGRRRLYEEQGDPFCVWEACYLIFEYGRWGIPMPPWVASYLLRAARRLSEISKAEPDPDELGPKVLGALEMVKTGRGTIFSRRRRVDLDAELARAVAQLRATTYDNAKDYPAIDEVARRYKTSSSTVGRAYRAAKVRSGDGTMVFTLSRSQFPNGFPDGSEIKLRPRGRSGHALAERYVVVRTLDQDDQFFRIEVKPPMA